MRIMYFGTFREHYRTEQYIRHGFESLGHEVIARAGEDVAALSLDDAELNSCDFVLFGKTRSEHVTEKLGILKGKVLTVCWQHDLYGIPSRHGFPPEYGADIVVATDGDIEKHAGIPNYHVIRQGIHEPEAYYHPTHNVRYSVVFVGHASEKFQPGRGALVNWLRLEYGDRFHHVTDVRGTRLNSMLAQSGIVVGDSYPSPNYWSNRIYEITGRGGFLLHPETEGLDAEYTAGEHYVSYRRGDFDQLRRLVARYTAAPLERERIRLAGHELTKSQYTYRQRCEQLIEIVSGHR